MTVETRLDRLRNEGGWSGPLGILAAVAVGLAALSLLDVLWHATLGVITEQEVFGDWRAYYRGAQALRAGGDVYAEAKTMVAVDRWEYWGTSDGQYVYPPFLALLLVPLTGLGATAAGTVWLVLLVGALAGWAVAMLRVLGRPFAPVPLAVVAVPVLVVEPLAGIYWGQPDIVLLLLTTLALLALRAGHDVRAGIALGVVVAVKPMLAVYGLPLLKARRWRALFAAALTGGVLGLGPFLWLGIETFSDWLEIARYYGGGSFATYPHNQSVRGTLLRAFVGGPFNDPLVDSRALADGVWMVAVIAALAAWWWVVPAGRTPTPAGWAATAVLLLFAAPLSEDIHYVALFFPLAVLADRAAWAGDEWRWQALAVGTCLWFAQPWLLRGTTIAGLPTVVQIVASATFLPGLALAAAGLWRLLRAEAAIPESPEDVRGGRHNLRDP